MNNLKTIWLNTFSLIVCCLISVSACQKDDEKTTTSGISPKTSNSSDTRKVMEYYDGTYDLYNLGQPTTMIHPDILGCRTVVSNEATLKKHIVVEIKKHTNLVESFVKDWYFITSHNEFGVFEDSITGMFKVEGENAFPKKEDFQRQLKTIGADLSVDFGTFPGFDSRLLQGSPANMRVYLLYNKDIKPREVTNEAYIVMFDPRVAISRGGIGEKGKNLAFVRRKVTQMTPEDFRWMNGDFYVDVPNKEYGYFIGMRVVFNKPDATQVVGEAFYPELFLKYTEEDLASPFFPYMHDVVPLWFVQHHRGLKQ